MAQKPFMTTMWSHLAMLNYEVDPGLLRPFVPRGTELDEYKGRHFVSVVGFLFRGTRLFGFPVPGYRGFPEVNLRFYVRYRSHEGWRRGVAFIKEIVPLRAVAWTARTFFDEKFCTHPMRYKIETDRGDLLLPTTVDYAWKTAAGWNTLKVTTEGTPSLPAAGSEEEFIAEHYWAYTARRDGCTSEYRVEHPPWRISPAVEACLECDVAGVYGPEFADFLGGSPRSSFLAEGSRVRVYRGERFRVTLVSATTPPDKQSIEAAACLAQARHSRRENQR